MKNYSDLIYKQLKVNKKRSIYTIFCIMLGIVLFTTIGYLKIFVGKVNIEYEKTNFGNYEACFYNINRDKVKELSNNVKIKEYGVSALENSSYISIRDIKKNMLVYAMDNTCIDNIFNKKISLKEGRFPKNNSEIVLDSNSKNQLDKSIGDKIVIANKSYDIVGVYEGDNHDPYTLTSITKLENIKNYKSINVFINIKGNYDIRKNIIEIANAMNIKLVDENKAIQYDNGNIENDEASLNLNEAVINSYENNVFLKIRNMNEVNMSFLFIDFGILLLTIVLTFNSINISVKERINYFATLRCMGATPEKIRYLLIKECLVLSILSIVPGLIIGYGVTYLIIEVVLKKIAMINFYGVTFSIYWSKLITAIILIGLVILLSSIIPVIKIGKISPIEGVKLGTFTLNKVKRRNSKIITKLFGYKGILAYKNIRANNRSFISITLIISTLLVVLVVFTGVYMTIVNDNKDEKFKDFTIQIMDTDYKKDNINSLNSIDIGFEKVEDIINRLKKTDSINHISSYVEVPLYAFEGKRNTFEYFENEVIKEENNVQVYTPNSSMLIYDDNSLKEILPYVKTIDGKNISMEDLKENGVILINKKDKKNNFSLNLNENNEKEIYLYSDVSSLDERKENKKPIDMKILGTIDFRHIIEGRHYEYFNGISFIVTREFYEKNKNLIFEEDVDTNNPIRIDFDFLNSKEKEKSLSTIKSYVNEISGFYLDNGKYAMEQRGSLLALATIVYTIIFFTMCIGIINIINNKNISISLRRQELATMLAIGVRRKKIKKIIILEGVIQWFISTLIGAVVSFTILTIIYFTMMYAGEIINKESILVSIVVFFLVSLILLIVNLISCIIALRGIKEFSVSEMLRSDE